MQHGPRGPPRGQMQGFRRDFPPNEDPAWEKAVRSIFVANVSFETTEEQLKAVLSEVGPVVSLKLIHDPTTGRPRGFGFCEFEDGETARSAVRNLTGREVNGRPLRIDSATNAPGGEMRGPGNVPPGPQGGAIEPPLHGPAVPPEAAPEAITKAVASLPPEQMFELMKQMKWCIERNPEETRQLLLHNPQLAYALLQAQVVMRIVDLETAQKILHREPRGPSLDPQPAEAGPSQPPPPPHQHQQGPPAPHRPPHPHQRRPSPPPPRRQDSPVEPGFGPPREHFGPPHEPPPPPPRRDERERFGGGPPPGARGPPPHRPPGRYGGGPMGPGPNRGPPDSGPRPMRGPPDSGPRPMRGPPDSGPRTMRGHPDSGPHPMRGHPDSGPRTMRGPPDSGPRSMRGPPDSGPPRGGPRSPPRSDRPGPSAPGNMGGLTPQDQEKAALIMQVLSLSDEQIQMLPPDQRNSILKLKEQISQSN
ncbi:Cleavage stimulation factor subunit 2 [Geodia barretti]|uniref:Cleavage stimulation factor subunit 2 n=1 Tax=Geodia barretti TaxID=519541 RepID=A0AA35X0X4_GEOBA|nr:Cleavage stimulation factor subunit 2 [Geodia barretti]